MKTKLNNLLLTLMASTAVYAMEDISIQQKPAAAASHTIKQLPNKSDKAVNEAVNKLTNKLYNYKLRSIRYDIEKVTKAFSELSVDDINNVVDNTIKIVEDNNAAMWSNKS